MVRVHLNSTATLLGLGLITSVQGFAPVSIDTTRVTPFPTCTRTPTSSLSSLPESINSVESVIQSSNLLLGKLTSDGYGELTKSVLIFLVFGGGLIPAAIAANSAMVGTLSGKRRGGDDNENYVSDSNASGPALPGQALIFASEKIPLVDVIAVIGRIQNVNSIAEWNKLPSTETAPNVMWLPRALFKENIRNAKFTAWPVDPKTGEPVGGAELEKAEKGRISKKNAEIGDAALDAVFDSWAWGASIATPDKVESTLKLYKNGNAFDVSEFSSAASRGRAVTGLGAATFIIIQVVAYGSLFIAPFLRVVFDLDIGFGQLGSCDGQCTGLF